VYRILKKWHNRGFFFDHQHQHQDKEVEVEVEVEVAGQGQQQSQMCLPLQGIQVFMIMLDDYQQIQSSTQYQTTTTTTTRTTTKVIHTKILWQPTLFQQQQKHWEGPVHH